MTLFNPDEMFLMGFVAGLIFSGTALVIVKAIKSLKELM